MDFPNVKRVNFRWECRKAFDHRDITKQVGTVCILQLWRLSLRFSRFSSLFTAQAEWWAGSR